MTIHWCGTGLSAKPGLRWLINSGFKVVVWNRTIEKAKDAVGDLAVPIEKFSEQAIRNALNESDILVSMLPGEWHVPLAEMAISKRANFVSSSYISPEMKALDLKAKEARVSLINEIGLDPGIDHLMAHKLIEDYRNSDQNLPENKLSFISYCGGIPKIPNDFKYKFSWSPLGVLKALKSPSKSILDSKEFYSDRPWNAISSYEAPLERPEKFEVYPNRDSLPFLRQYNFDPKWQVKKFVRGTLRLHGWSKAWKPIFDEIETLSGSDGDKRLKEMSETFWQENAYAEDEADRVVLCVNLNAENNTSTLWNKTYVMDAYGDNDSTAMARLVSYPVSYAIEATLSKKIPFGVSAATNDSDLNKEWLENISNISQYCEIIDHLK